MLSEKKFSRECVRVCVKETRTMKHIEELLDFYLTANNETRNVTGLIKEAITASVRVADNNLVIGILGKLFYHRPHNNYTEKTSRHRYSITPSSIMFALYAALMYCKDFKPLISISFQKLSCPHLFS